MSLRAVLHEALNSSDPKQLRTLRRKSFSPIFLALTPATMQKKFGVETDKMREAACHVYARNVCNPNDPDAAALAVRFLPQYFNDECEEVRKHVANAFWHIDGERLLQLKELILKFIESRSFETDPDDILRALETSSAELPHVICRAAERILEIIGDKGTSMAHRGAVSAIRSPR